MEQQKEMIMTNRMDRGFLAYQDEFEEAALRVLRSGWYIMGKELKEFEEAFAAYCGAKYCLGTGNGLDALSLACRAIGLQKGDEVLVQGNTFIASIMGIAMDSKAECSLKPTTIRVDLYDNAYVENYGEAA